jgi:hypothetical protein
MLHRDVRLTGLTGLTGLASFSLAHDINPPRTCPEPAQSDAPRATAEATWCN